MGTKGSRRRDEDDDDDDDRPRRRRRDRDEDEDEDDRPRSRRRRSEDEYDDDERPRRRRREEEDDEDDRPRPRRKPRRKSGGPSAGLIVGLILGTLALIGGIVAVVMLVGGSSISYAKFKEIHKGQSIEDLEKKFGKATKIERSEWSQTRLGDGRFGRDSSTTLAALDPFGGQLQDWYHWHSGSEDIYVATGKDQTGRIVPIYKAYSNTNAAKENERHADEILKGDLSKMIPGFEGRGIE
jgi:hypothetical protein